VADLSDVENALVSAILAAATSPAGACPQLAGSKVRVYRGSPPTTALTLDRAAGIVDVTVFPVPDATRNTTRWGVQSTLLGVQNGLSASVSGESATFSGTALGGELAGVLVNDQPFVYVARAGDSAALVASALADLVRSVAICTVTLATLTIPSAVTLVARTAGVASILQELGRQEQDFRIGVFAPSPSTRDGVCGAISASLAAIVFLTLADGCAGRLRYVRTASFDDDQVASIYRRSLIFSVEYPTTAAMQDPTMLFGASDYNGVITYV
jgi:hypothetical protein